MASRQAVLGAPGYETRVFHLIQVFSALKTDCMCVFERVGERRRERKREKLRDNQRHRNRGRERGREREGGKEGGTEQNIKILNKILHKESQPRKVSVDFCPHFHSAFNGIASLI